MTAVRVVVVPQSDAPRFSATVRRVEALDLLEMVPDGEDHGGHYMPADVVRQVATRRWIAIDQDAKTQQLLSMRF